MGWTFESCIHGVQEGLDSHECGACAAISREIGLKDVVMFHRPFTEADAEKWRQDEGVRDGWVKPASMSQALRRAMQCEHEDVDQVKIEDFGYVNICFKCRQQVVDELKP